MAKTCLDICDSIYGHIDLTQLEPLIHHRLIQLLNRIKSLGALCVIFPGATHTRFAHSLGTAHQTGRRAKAFEDRGLITPSQFLAVSVSALVHDVGHRPFSHMIEALVGDHNDHVVALVEQQLSSTIASLGADPALVISILKREHPLASLIFQTPYGTDRLDYLRRDEHLIGGHAPNLDAFLSTHCSWRPDRGLYLLSRGLVEFLGLMNFYWTQYAGIYERLSGRVVQRNLQELIRQSIREAPHLLKYLEQGGEDELIGAISFWCDGQPPDHPCSKRLDLFLTRQHPKKCLIFAENPFAVPVRAKGGFSVLACDADLINRSQRWSFNTLEQLERQLSCLLKIPVTHISVAAAPSGRRWQLPTVPVATSQDEFQPVQTVAPGLSGMAEAYRLMTQNVVVSIGGDSRQAFAHDPGVQAVVRQLLDTA